MGEQSTAEYMAYMIRSWHEGNGVWRSTLENPHTGERRAFANIESLCLFLQQQTGKATFPSTKEDNSNIAEVGKL
jgi:hypothetical protein